MPHPSLPRLSGRLLSALLLVTLVMACSPIDRLKRAQQQDSGSFASNLAAEYLAFAESEQELGQKAISRHFAHKGLQAAHGKPTPPEQPENWDMDAASLKELLTARERLMKVNTHALQRVASHKVARAQLLYDCWVVQAHQREEQDAALPCTSQFRSEMRELEQITRTFGTKPKVSLPAHYTLYYPIGGTRIGKDAAFTVQEVLATARLFPEYTIEVTGHTDRAGSEERNRLLSQQRAENATQALIAAGIPAERITTSADGEDNPAEPTLDGIYRQRNRRVEISVLPVMVQPAASPALYGKDTGSM